MFAKVKGPIHHPIIKDQPGSWAFQPSEIPSFCMRCVGTAVHAQNNVVGHIESVWLSPTDGFLWATAFIHDSRALVNNNAGHFSLSLKAETNERHQRVSPYQVSKLELVQSSHLPNSQIMGTSRI